MWRYTAGSGLPICVLHGEEVLHQLMPWQELFVMIAAGAISTEGLRLEGQLPAKSAHWTA